MRSEKRNRFLSVLMALVLLASVPAVYLRVQLASFKVTSGDLGVVLGHTGTYLDRTGGVLKDKQTATPDVLGNLIGFGGYVNNSLYSKYEDLLSPDSFNRITGIRSLKDKQGSVLNTTLLPLSGQQAIASAFCDNTGHVYNGAVFAYNYVTGEVYTALSLPSVGSMSADMPADALYNKVLKGTYTPGSTMKVVAMLVALEQSNVRLDDFRYTCTSVDVLPGGEKITCGGAHGTLSIVDALGRSCNCFITKLASTFNVLEACDSLHRMGFSTQQGQAQTQYVDMLARSGSSTVFADPNAFSDRWSFAGQGNTVVSCVDMAMIAGAVANGGIVVEPYIVVDITNQDTGEVSQKMQTSQKTLFSETVAERADQYWTQACDRYYHLSCQAISYAKTGTAEHGDGTTSRSLLGVMKEYNTAFFVYVEGLKSGDTRCVQIAAKLAETLETNNVKG